MKRDALKWPKDRETGKSRQRRWQEARIAAGLCERCGEKRGKRGTPSLCADCRERHNALRRKAS